MLVINNVSKKYGKTTALNDISLKLNKGACLGLVGPNGAGKSTLLKIIVHIVQAYEGKIIFTGTSNTDQKRTIGYVPQDICLEENVSAIQNLYFFGRIYQLRGKALQKQAEKVLRYVGLSERKKDKVKTFSGGMKRRLNIGCALMHEPQFIIMDEPTVGIDPQSRHYILDMIKQMKEENRTIIYSSHYIEEVNKICDEVAFIDQGKLIEHDTIHRLIEKHAVPAIFFACPNSESLLKDLHQLSDHIQPYKNGYKLTTAHPMRTMEELLGICREKKLALKQFELIYPTLEDIFFKLTGTELRA
ncbi:MULTISPECIES: ABC transporter ATP-binding protein [Clostridia]|uniref:ABC transporter ATP-binding protein n=1 Tax=Clostridia TaxID=186801 RepID=UPI000EA23868|nr:MULTISPECIES: ABC transporter ATP-binding protein [Clostridia]NBJ69526.1 ABC transporter ATP-binding protein [Roseburia sp. 1XD42-34]RKI78598.1 ABC transporter ATP-binding protein [Clostridium sp. 1xD42-85]